MDITNRERIWCGQREVVEGNRVIAIIKGWHGNAREEGVKPDVTMGGGVCIPLTCCRESEEKAMVNVVFISERSELELIGDKYAETVLQNGSGLERMSGSDAKVGKGNAGVGKFRKMQCPECEYGHWCTKVSPGVQITPGGFCRYREKC